MFLRANKRFKDGKPHRYWSVVENRRVAGERTVQKTLLDLGEINDSDRASWTRAVLKDNYSTHASAGNALDLARGVRNETQDLIYAILKQYRQRIPSEFAEGSAILESLPRLSPLPGSTPDAVELSGTYDAATGNSQLAWSEVTDDNVTELQLRATAGPEFDPDDESILATLAPSDPRTWTGSLGFLVPGSAASFKLYSLTAEGNERGSNAVTITRPAP